MPAVRGPEGPARPARVTSASRPARRPATARTTSRSSPRSTTPRQLSLDAILAEARRYRASGADVIDLGCDPGEPWAGVGDAVRMLQGRRLPRLDRQLRPGRGRGRARGRGRTGAERQRHERRARPALARALPRRRGGRDPRHAGRPRQPRPHRRTCFATTGVKFRLDPILEPIGFGFAASLGRYLEARRRYPDAEMMMGVGNLTELTDVDSAGVNVLLAGFCQELGIRSVLTTEVINWCRSSVKEFDLARRLVYHAVREKVLPKRLEPDLVHAPRPEAVRAGRGGARGTGRARDRPQLPPLRRARRDPRPQRQRVPARHRPVRAVRARSPRPTRSSTRRTPSTSATRWPRR